MDQNLVTWKIKYECDKSLLNVMKQYSSLLHCTYNKLSSKSMTFSELNAFQKSLKNCDNMNSWLRTSAEYEAKAMLKANPNGDAIFGGRKLFISRCRQKVSKEDFQIKKLSPIYSIGEANQRGNRLFRLIGNSTISFSLNKQIYILNLISVGSNRLKGLDKLVKLQNNKQAAITYKVDLNFVYITFDYNLLKQYSYKVKQNRIFAIDLNPNSVGWSVVDWKFESNYTVVQSGTFSLKSLNDYRNSKHVSSNSNLSKYVTNKRDHEIIEISKQLFNLCKHYHCEVFAIEDLSIANKDNKLGRKFNRLVNNQWNRSLLVNQIRKRVNASSTKLVEVQPQYSSYIGNLLYRKQALPDECLASIEIGRRGWEFSTQYIFKRRLRNKTVIFPNLESAKNQLSISLEEIGIDVSEFEDWVSICREVKKSKTKYRFSSEEARKRHSERLFSIFYKQKFLRVYNYL